MRPTIPCWGTAPCRPPGRLRERIESRTLPGALLEVGDDEDEAEKVEERMADRIREQRLPALEDARQYVSEHADRQEQQLVPVDDAEDRAGADRGARDPQTGPKAAIQDAAEQQ